jgi:hypothetical protein
MLLSGCEVTVFFGTAIPQTEAWENDGERENFGEQVTRSGVEFCICEKEIGHVPLIL